MEGVNPQKPDELSHREYWDQRYKALIDQEVEGNSDEGKVETYDWFRNWEQLESWFRDILRCSSSASLKILHLGCGNSVGVLRWIRLKYLYIHLIT